MILDGERRGSSLREKLVPEFIKGYLFVMNIAGGNYPGGAT
jgi:hypothetical protein